MDQIERLASDIQQMVRRVDDHAMRIAVLETRLTGLDEKLDEIKEAIRSWNKIGLWLVTLIGGALILASLKFITDGGLATTTKAMGL